jgi:hypothetical protein
MWYRARIGPGGAERLPSRQKRAALGIGGRAVQGLVCECTGIQDVSASEWYG